ncbi:hypothetical protein B0H13DRAFT_2313863 [Mycena leptocephala]|nr:hypothetical protein B0H13DRAFT_2313863 [Mycena leptocephala]
MSGIFELCPTIFAPRPLPSVPFSLLYHASPSDGIIVGLVLGCIVAGAAGYIDNSSIKSAPAITFLWYAPPPR